jgi:hypothetical protein
MVLGRYFFAIFSGLLNVNERAALFRLNRDLIFK